MSNNSFHWLFCWAFVPIYTEISGTSEVAVQKRHLWRTMLIGSLRGHSRWLRPLLEASEVVEQLIQFASDTRNIVRYDHGSLLGRQRLLFGQLWYRLAFASNRTNVGIKDILVSLSWKISVSPKNCWTRPVWCRFDPSVSFFGSTMIFSVLAV